ncbi:hypothetical protein [Streptomyces sp. NPDC048410]|uniref:hypothetical protein n=1 Tax=Streptomyces sp. NPDC048410 TaxID=3365545 RepID=UPI003710AE04
MDSAAKLQIYSVEERSLDTAVCVVRCVGGIVRVGQEFGAHLTLDRIIRYDQAVDFMDPPHGAQVRLSGAGVRELEKGVIITAG